MINLILTELQATILLQIMASVGGSPRESPRQISDEIFHMLWKEGRNFDHAKMLFEENNNRLIWKDYDDMDEEVRKKYGSP